MWGTGKYYLPRPNCGKAGVLSLPYPRQLPFGSDNFPSFNRKGGKCVVLRTVKYEKLCGRSPHPFNSLH